MCRLYVHQWNHHISYKLQIFVLLCIKNSLLSMIVKGQFAFYIFLRFFIQNIGDIDIQFRPLIALCTDLSHITTGLYGNPCPLIYISLHSTTFWRNPFPRLRAGDM